MSEPGSAHRAVTFLLLPVAAFLAAALQAAPAAADSGEWTSGGPPDRIVSIVVDPSNENHELAAGTDGLWNTTDGGATWTNSVPGPDSFGRLSIDPLAPNNVYAVAGNLHFIFKSSDSGANWSTILSVGSPGPRELVDVLADPNSPGVVYASGMDSYAQDQVWRSADSGQTWTVAFPHDKRGQSGTDPPNMTALAGLPGAPGVILAGATYYHGGGVLATRDGGAHWTTVYHDELSYLAGVHQIASAGTGTGMSIYVSLSITQGGSLIRSDDGGATWVKLTDGLPIQGSTYGGIVAAVQTDPGDPDSVYIAEWDTATPPSTGVFVSADRGETWSELGHLVAKPNGLALSVGARTLHAATDAGVYDFSLDGPSAHLSGQ